MEPESAPDIVKMEPGSTERAGYRSPFHRVRGSDTTQVSSHSVNSARMVSEFSTAGRSREAMKLSIKFLPRWSG